MLSWWPRATVAVKLSFCLSLLFFSCDVLPGAGYREGFLWKRGRDNGQYLSRRFILSEREGVLKYFNKNDVSRHISSWQFLLSCLRKPSIMPSSMPLVFFFCLFLKAREPKAMMKIGSLNATFQPSKIGTPHGLQITYLKDNSTRNIFVYHEDGKVKPTVLSSRGHVLTNPSH